MYELREELPSAERFVALREAAGMTERSLDAVRDGLPNSLYGVTVVHEQSGDVVGMARVVGDGATVFHVCDTAVHPDHQRRGVGSRLMDAVMDYLAEHAPASAYVNLMADVDGFYERWGFEETRPASKGMYRP